MDHDDALALLDVAAVEPGGLDRLMAGDTSEAAALAGHVAACDVCPVEMERLRRVSAVVGEAIRSMPPPELRERTLAFVRNVGREHSSSRVGSAPVPERRVARTRWFAAIAAAVLIAVAGTGSLTLAVMNDALRSRDAALERQEQVVSALAAVTSGMLRIESMPDARRVALDSPRGGEARATIVLSPAAAELVIVAWDLAEPPEGKELRCWVEVEGKRQRVGRIFFGGGLGYWVGRVDGLDEVEPGARFGVSLVDAGSEPVGDDVVLTGELEPAR